MIQDRGLAGSRSLIGSDLGPTINWADVRCDLCGRVRGAE